MHALNEVSLPKEKYEECDTIFFQGLGASQTQVLKYIGKQKIQASTGQIMWCIGRNNLQPLYIVYKPHIGPEISDVNLQPFDTTLAWFNPFKIVNSMMTYVTNRRNGFHFRPANSESSASVKYHTLNINAFSIGQASDISSHFSKYESWKNKAGRSNGLILLGTSRGTAATFCAFAKFKYPEVKLVILEGAIDSVPKVIPARIACTFKNNAISKGVTQLVNNGFSFFKKKEMIQYSADGLSPLESVKEFPKGVPVVFVTSKTDTVVPCINTENIAQELANQSKNDVYLLKLECSSHPNYMFDDASDRDTYEHFIHAIYKKYHLRHEADLAEKGEILLEKFRVHPNNDLALKNTA